ncbi:hypothetical protein ARMSODRAFT_893855, partial [Armillaria solidipes]
EAIETPFNTEDAPHASTGYLGLREETWKRHHTLEELTGPRYGFTHYPWTGSDPVPVTDRDGRVIAVMAGQPDDPNWDHVQEEAAERMETSRKECKFSPDQRAHRRGQFAALSYGISYGGGQTHPQNLHHTGAHTSLIMSLINCLAFIRLAGFASSAFATWAPNLFHYYALHLRDLLLHDATLMLNWTHSIFAAATFNFGPRTPCFRHTDSGNLPFGWCAITALGQFDHRRGGHLVLWDLKLVIDFPPGSTILIPSAILRHLNTNIGWWEKRYSFTQYTAGGLFRWVDYGFRTSEEYWGSLNPAEQAAAKQTREERWRMGLGMFSTLDDLRRRATGA